MSARMEDVDSFRLRARAWIKANLSPQQKADLHPQGISDEEELSFVARDRAIQRKLFDGGFAGLCFPREYGGQGLTAEHQRAFNEELAGYEYPSRLAVPTFSPCATVLLEYGTEAQKRAHLPAILKGEEIWVQMLSEPGGGSDVAGATTSAVRNGDHWLLNGSKIWTSGAWWADWGLCLARTNWDVPKHKGLTVFILPLHQPGLEIHRIERLTGEREFCQEFLTDVRVPDSDRIGAVDNGWTVGQRWMYYERVGHHSQYVTRPTGLAKSTGYGPDVVDAARQGGRLDDPRGRDLIGEARILSIATNALERRLAAIAASGNGNDQISAVGRLFRGEAHARISTIAFDLAGASAASWSEGEDAPVLQFLTRQTSSIGGGTTEIARNVIAERVLGMPREPSGDRDIPFRDVPRGPRRG